MFWILSSIANILVFAALFVLFEMYNFEQNLAMKVKYVACHSIYIIISLTLSFMGLKYRHERPESLRNYLSSPNPLLAGQHSGQIHEHLLAHQTSSDMALRNSQISPASSS
jgi:hypothetical protein